MLFKHSPMEIDEDEQCAMEIVHEEPTNTVAIEEIEILLSRLQNALSSLNVRVKSGLFAAAPYPRQEFFSLYEKIKNANIENTQKMHYLMTLQQLSNHATRTAHAAQSPMGNLISLKLLELNKKVPRFSLK